MGEQHGGALEGNELEALLKRLKGDVDASHVSRYMM